MAKNIKKIAGDLKKYLKKAAKREEKQAKEQILKELKDRTPVDTGLTRDSWKISDEGVTNKEGAVVKALNQGHSKQAPLGITDQALAVVKDRRDR